MQQYWVEGLFITKKGRQKAAGRGKPSQADIEPFYRSYWAASPAEALQLAEADLQGGEWVEKPKVSQTSEEQRMRASGAPMLPGLGEAKPKARRK